MKLRMVNSYTVRVTGMDLENATRAEWRKWLADLGRDCQDTIAEYWDMEMTGTRRALLPNSPEYTARKLAKGLDPRRGHRTGRLQRAIEGASLFSVSAVSDSGTATITFSEARLIARVRERGVNYVPYYVASKVPIIKRVMQMSQPVLAEASARWLATVLGELNLRRRKPHPVPIRATAGLNQAFMRGLQRSIPRPTAAQNRVLQRMIRRVGV